MKKKMTNLEDYKNSWENDEVQVEILFSAAGVGTTIALISKFTGKIMLLDVGDGAIRDLLLSQNSHEFKSLESQKNHQYPWPF